jgi:hypothetical protein
VLASSWTGLTWRDLYSTNPAQARDTKLTLLAGGLESIIRRIDRPGTRTILIADMATPYYTKVTDCTLAAVSGLLRRVCDPADLTISSQQIRPMFDPVDDALADVARRTGVTFLRPTDKMCNEATCLSRINGEFIWRETSHLRRNLSADTISELAEVLGLDQIFRGLD